MYLAESLQEIKSYKPARLCTGVKWYVEYYVYHIELKTMIRKRIMLNHIDKISDRRAFAYQLMRKLNAELEKGWNPYIAEENSRSYALLPKLLEEFMNLQRKKRKEGDIREATILSYESYYNKLREYLVKEKLLDLYVYYFNKEFISKYLDYVYNERDLSSRTRDNYLKFIRLFCNYLVDRSFLKVSPAESISVLGKSKRAAKNRTVLPVDIMAKVSEYLNKNNRYFLIAAQILYFCMVRPKEMSYIKIKHIDLNRSVIFVDGQTAKNYDDGLVTITESLNSLISEMGIMDQPGEYYLFSHGFKPGAAYCRPTLMSKYWGRYVRKALNLPLTLKFYSLKDTGITDMIRTHNDPLLARDQARHHDLSITNMYLPSDMKVANETIKKDSRKF
ncbi:MAG: tyrosine-type recombinase/integrase [Bacteroidales bacterium]